MLKPSIHYRQASTQHTRTVSGVLQTNETITYPYASRYYFDVLGFGYNDPLEKDIPTAGEYYKHHQQGSKGRVETVEYYYGSEYARDVWDGHIADLGAYFSNDPIYFDSGVYNNSLSELWDQIKRVQEAADINLALSLGEAREAGRTLQVGKSIYEVLVTARKAKRQFLMNPSKTMSEIWLSYKYGWQPLLNDIYGYLNWVYDLLDDGVPVRARSWKTVRHNYDLVYSSNPVTALSTGRTRYQSEVKVWVRTSNATLANLSRITSLNPLSIGWELLPLSFVVDWFYDVGGFLQNMEAAFGSGLEFDRGYVTELVYNKETSQHKVDGYTGFWPSLVHRTGYYEASRIVVWKRRQKLNAFPFPRAPAFNFKLGAQRMISAAALLRTILLGKVQGRRV